MFRHLLLFLAAVLTLSAARPVATSTNLPPATRPVAQQSDTLTAGVFPPNPTVLKGATRDLADLDVRLVTLKPGELYAPEEDVDSLGHLLIVKDGTIVVSNNPIKTLGPGGVGLYSAFMLLVSNQTTSKASFYLFTFESRAGTDRRRAMDPDPFFFRDWPELVMKPTPKGESRAIFSQPTMSLKNINMHATTLNPGEMSHPQHMHRAEEILLIRSGNVRMHIGNDYIPAKGGDLVFLPSGVPHNLENGNTGRTEYFALQWEQ
jgi:mannose-6-phosphate isomerase-like protein (cupin superfamily)